MSANDYPTIQKKYTDIVTEIEQKVQELRNQIEPLDNGIKSIKEFSYEEMESIMEDLEESFGKIHELNEDAEIFRVSYLAREKTHELIELLKLLEKLDESYGEDISTLITMGKKIMD